MTPRVKGRTAVDLDDGGGVGFWAELYVVEDGSYETFYRNVDPIGLEAVATPVPVADERRPLGTADGASAPDDSASNAR